MGQTTDKPFFDRRPLPSAFPLIEVALPDELRAKLTHHCLVMGDKAADVIVDALAAVFDELDGAVVPEGDVARALSDKPWTPDEPVQPRKPRPEPRPREPEPRQTPQAPKQGAAP